MTGMGPTQCRGKQTRRPEVEGEPGEYVVEGQKATEETYQNKYLNGVLSEDA